MPAGGAVAVSAGGGSAAPAAAAAPAAGEYGWRVIVTGQLCFFSVKILTIESKFQGFSTLAVHYVTKYKLNTDFSFGQSEVFALYPP